MAQTGQTTRSSVRLYILHVHMYEDVSATGRNYTLFVVVSIIITIRIAAFVSILITMYSSWLNGTKELHHIVFWNL